jgi:GNAT superfamily N-acetyltransferase
MSTNTTARAWRAQFDEAEAVAELLVGFRDHMGSDWPSANAFLASVERLLEDPHTEFLLAAAGDDLPPAGVLQLRFRFSVWRAAPDAWLEDLFVSEEARRAGLGDALVTLAIERARERGAADRARLQRGEYGRAGALRAPRLLAALEGRRGAGPVPRPQPGLKGRSADQRARSTNTRANRVNGVPRAPTADARRGAASSPARRPAAGTPHRRRAP